MSEYYFTIGKGDNTHEVSVDIDLTAIGGKEHKKHMNKTVLNTCSSNTKQATLSYKKQLILSQLAKNLNQKSSQGLICYESLHFVYDCFEDEITIFENQIDNELKNYNIDVDKINNLRWMDLEDMESRVSRIELPDEYNEKTTPTFYIPQSTINQAEWKRGWGSKITDAVFKMYISVFSDRLDRIECKRDILAYTKHNTKPDHTVASVLVGEIHTEEYEVPDINVEFEIQTKEDLKKYSHLLPTWSDRYPAMKKVDEYNSDYMILIEDWIDILTECFDLDNNKPYLYDKIKTYGQKYDKVTLLSLLCREKVNNATGPYKNNNTPWNIKTKKEFKSKMNEYGGGVVTLRYMLLSYLRNQNKFRIEQKELKKLLKNIESIDNYEEKFDYIIDHDFFQTPTNKKETVYYIAVSKSNQIKINY